VKLENWKYLRLKGSVQMTKFPIRIKDRQTGRCENIWIEANSRNEAKAIAIQRFGVSHEVIG
jgi:hypothetical protein